MIEAINIAALYTFAIGVLYPITKYTTIGNYVWFSDLMYRLADMFDKEGTKSLIERISYSKLFVCRPCHTFWLSLAFSSFLFSIVPAVIHSLAIYLIIRTYDDKRQK